MANILKVLGQSNPGTTLTDLYVVPANAVATVSSIIVAETGAGARTYRIAVRPLGAEVALKHYIFYDRALAANDSDKHVVGLTLGAGDVVSVYGSSTDVSFSMFGVETRAL